MPVFPAAPPVAGLSSPFGLSAALKSPVELDTLKQTINSKALPSDLSEVHDWHGANVTIVEVLDEVTQDWLGTQPGVIISVQKTEPRRRAVVTNFSKEVRWLFYQLREMCSEYLDYVTKYDFYGTLAQSAMDYLDCHRGTESQTGLLTAVVEEAEKWVCGEIGAESTVH